MWCGLAEEVEAFRDRNPGRDLDDEVDRWHDPGLQADQESLHELLARAPELVVAGDQLFVDIDPLRELSSGGWAVQLERAQALAPRLPEPEPALGIDLGW